MCVPCQVVIWNDRAAAMLASVTTIAKINLSGGKGWPGDAWGKHWYEALENACEGMEELLNELVVSDAHGGSGGGNPHVNVDRGAAAGGTENGKAVR